jgi:hypothetical protein
MMQHEDFVIIATDAREVTDDGRRRVTFRVQVPGRVTEAQETGYDASQLHKLVSNWETVPPKLSKVIQVGQMLGEALFPKGLVRDAFLASLAAHRNKEDSRLRLVLELTGILHNVPWEFALFRTEQGEATQNEILGLMSQVSIVRRLSRILPDLKGTKPAVHPAQMVMALADPRDTLDLEEERRLVKDSLGDSHRVQVKYVDRATSDGLLGGLEQVHLFHFAGHGEFKERPTPGVSFGQGALVLDDGSGNEDGLPAPILATRLVHAGVRVAFLGACLTARRDDVNMWSSTAANLINGGIGAVVGMQFVVRDKSAIAFAQAFYETLALGYPVDQAVTKGRIAIFEQEDYRGFGTPVLYMGTGDGIVFPEFTDDPELAAERAKTRVVVNLSADVVEGEVTGIHVETMSGGEAEVTMSVIEVKDGRLVGFSGGIISGGNVRVKQDFDKIGKGVVVEGAHIDSLGPSKPAVSPPSAPDEIACPSCGGMVQVGAKFCGHCGGKLASGSSFCQECGSKLPAGAKFCNECGTAVT